MTLDELKLIIAQNESKILEFKESTAKLKSACETLCAFLNNHGGVILIGVKNNGQIIGQHVTDNTRQEIANEISKIEPTASVEVDYVSIDGNKFVIVIKAVTGQHAPYVYDGRPFHRTESTTSKMSQHRYEQLLVERGQLKHSWEEWIASGYTIDDLDHNEIRLAVKQGISVGRVPAVVADESLENILQGWALLTEGKINNAAAILFAKKVLPRYTQCHIKLGRYRGTNRLGDFIDNKEFFGNAFRMFEEANSFITRHLPIASFFEPERFERLDRPALPVLAVREALVNAICHRDYSNRATAITVAIFDDRMEIWNNGKLPPSLKIDNLKKKHKSEPRNKVIAKVFYDRKYFDGWGTGINKIYDLCHEEGVPEPVYEEYSGGVEIIFKFRELIAITSLPLKQPLSIRQEEILKIIKKLGGVSPKLLIDKLDNPPSERMIRNDLNYLKKCGLIDIKGSARSTLWVLKK